MKMKLATIGAFAVLGAYSGAVTIYDNFPNWDGNITSAWFGQAQRFVVPNVDNILVDWKSEFASAMGGLPVNFSIRDEVAGIPGESSYNV